MKKLSSLVFIAGVLLTHQCVAKDETETFYIPAPPSDTSLTPNTPFFADPSAAEEVAQRLESLEARVKDLERNFSKSKNNLTISSDGTITLKAKNKITIEAPIVKMPK